MKKIFVCAVLLLSLILNLQASNTKVKKSQDLLVDIMAVIRINNETVLSEHGHPYFATWKIFKKNPQQIIYNNEYDKNTKIITVSPNENAHTKAFDLHIEFLDNMYSK